MNKQLLLLLMFVAATVIAACSGQAESEAESESCEASVTGAITFPGRTDLQDAVVEVAVLDASITPSKVVGSPKWLGHQQFSNPGQLPVSYEVCYDPGEIEEGVTYTVYVNVEQLPSGMTLGLNEALNPVITGGNPTKDVEIVVTPGFRETQ